MAEGLGLAVVDPIPARELAGLPIVLRPFRRRLPIFTMLIRPADRPPSRPAMRLGHGLRAEREALVHATTA